MQLHLAGESLMGWMVWDLMRSVDFLMERPYIDPRRIIMLGAVAGGGGSVFQAGMPGASGLSLAK
jgi:cephalosporin-C deacetylase-like acetyl esterase